MRVKFRAEEIHVGVISTEVVIRKEIWNILYNRAQTLEAWDTTLRVSSSWDGKNLHYNMQSSKGREGNLPAKPH